MKAKAARRHRRLRTRKPENGVSVSLLMYLPVGLMTLPSKYQFKAQGAEAKPKATAKKKPPKKEASSDD